MKKVLFIGATYYDFRDAVPRHLQEKFSGLSKELGVFVVARGQPFRRNIWGCQFYLLPKGLFWWWLGFVLGFYLCLTKKIDVIVAQSPLMEGLLGTLLKKFFKIELIVEVHGDWLEGAFLSKKRRLEKLEKKAVPFLAKLSLKAADKIRAISSYTKDQALKISGPKPCFVFPTFTDIDLFLEEKNTKLEDFILFVGALERVKGVDILIDAFVKISSDFPSFKLVLIGAGGEKKDLEFRIKNFCIQPCKSCFINSAMAELMKHFKNSGLETKVEFKGRLSLDQTKEIMKNCYCLVLPSRSEGLGRVLMEAAALGKPVIGSEAGGIPDLIQDGKNGFLVKTDNSDDLAQRLRTLLGNRELARAMGQNGRKMIEEKFSNERYLENYLKMIKM